MHFFKKTCAGLAVSLLAAFLLQGCSHKDAEQVPVPERPSAYNPEYEMDRELSIASSSPDALVGTDVYGIAGISPDSMDYDDDVELNDKPESLLSLPQGMRDLESRGDMPAVRAKTRKSREHPPAAGRKFFCTGSETICITSPYGVQRPAHTHKGVDIRASFGSPIKAFRGGRVTSAGYNGNYGYMVEILQSDGISARYAHMSQILTHAGAEVPDGGIIGRVGSTGRSTGPHLHFELLRNHNNFNPLTQLGNPREVIALGAEGEAAAARAAMSRRSSGDGDRPGRRDVRSSKRKSGGDSAEKSRSRKSRSAASSSSKSGRSRVSAESSRRNDRRSARKGDDGRRRDKASSGSVGKSSSKEQSRANRPSKQKKRDDDRKPKKRSSGK